MMESALIQNDAPRVTVLHTLKGWIRDGRLSLGDALPSERDIANQLGVNRSSVRWALRALKDGGLIRDQGRCTRVVAIGGEKLVHTSLLSDTVVVISPVPMTASESYWDPSKTGWNEGIARGVMHAVSHEGQHLFVLQDVRVTEELVDSVIAGKPHGFILPEVTLEASVGTRLLQRLSEGRVAVAAYGGHPDLAGYDRVVSDHESGAYELTRFLIEQGRRRILNVWPAPATGYWFPQRLAGYRRAIREAGLQPLEPVLVPFLARHADASDQARRFVGYIVDHLVGAEPADAIMADTDGHVVWLSAACRLCGKTPGKDILLTGYDNYWRYCPGIEGEEGPIATVDKLNWDAGRELFQLLSDRINGRLPAEPQCRVLKPKLVIRASE